MRLLSPGRVTREFFLDSQVPAQPLRGDEGGSVKEQHSPPVTGTFLLGGGGGQSLDSKMIIKVQKSSMNCVFGAKLL